MATIPDQSDRDYATLFGEERQVLLALLQSLLPDEWMLPTSCPGWSVLDLSLHLLGDDLGLLARQRDGHFATRPPDDLSDDDTFATWLDALQDSWVAATRRVSPRIVADLLGWTGPQVVEMLRAQDPTERAASVTWASSGLVPRWLDHARELSEQWIHRQQLLDALDSPADPGGPTEGAVLDALRWAYPHTLSKAPARDGDTVAIALSGPVERLWLLQYKGLTWDFTDEPGKRILARVQMSSGDAWRLLTNNMPPAEQLCLDVKGQPDVVEILLRTRSIIGIAK
jgi:uncharacterized protein (TIGR03083 family)